MILFVDASAMVSILTREEDAAYLADRLVSADRSLTSAIAVWEAALAVARSERTTVERAEADVAALLAQTRTSVVPIGPEEARAALDAHARFGKGRHPAGLNLGDCFAYACARTHGAVLLYKGGDFALTDLEGK